jgi:heme/copper-type cytochrome/quinol oxidase subunit 1
MIQIALIWFVLGATVGGLMLANKGLQFAPSIWVLYPAHIHMMLIGWTAQLATGVAFWILPRLNSQGSRGDERLGWVSSGCINAGVAITVLTGIAPSALFTSWLTALASLLYSVAALAFVAHAWPRVRPLLKPTN